MRAFSWLKGEKILYYPGCLTKGILRQEFENYKEIFNLLGIDFVMLSDDEVCCGLPVLNAGYRKDARKLAVKNLKLFREQRIDKIVTNCPSCYHMFGSVYPKLVRDWDIPVEHATVTICEKLRKLRLQVAGCRLQEEEVVAYHDPCHLGRYSGIYEEPREVIRLLGGKIVESRFNREGALCCGGGGGVRANFERLAKGIARERVKTLYPEVAGGRWQVAGISKIISPCGLCYANMKSVSDKSVEFSSFVLGRLRGLRR